MHGTEVPSVNNYSYEGLHMSLAPQRWVQQGHNFPKAKKEAHDVVGKYNWAYLHTEKLDEPV